MKMNKRMQYGMLLALYLCRSGRTTVAHAAEGLGLSESFLQQISRRLRIGGVIKVTKGPHGGIELIGEPTVLDVLNCLGGASLVSGRDYASLMTGAAEHRAMARYLKCTDAVLWPQLRQKIKTLGHNLVVDEVGRLNNKGLEAGAIQ